MRYPISADRLELMTKLLVVAFQLELAEQRRESVARERRRPKRASRPGRITCGA